MKKFMNLGRRLKNSKLSEILKRAVSEVITFSTTSVVLSSNS